MKVIVCGGRDYTDEEMLRLELSMFDERTPITVLIHGGAKGADTMAGKWATDQGIPVRVYKADWESFGKSAGVRRNQLMLDKEEPNMVIAFPGGRGTAHMVMIATEGGYPVEEIGKND